MAIKRLQDKIILWFTSVSFAWFVALFIGLGMRQRMSHNKGVAGKGKIKIVDDPEFPEHDFFSAGREFDCRVRHASVTFNDDAMNQVRGISIKFADTDFKSPLDLEANTGRISIFWTAANFLKFVWNRRESGGIQYKAYYEKEPDGLKGAQESGKYKPTSFATMDYYSKTPMRFVAKSGDEYYAKYRVVPYDLKIEEAAIPEEQKEKVYDQRVKGEEDLSVNYLVKEYEERIKNGPIQYRLQIQLFPSEVDPDQRIFDSRIEWDAKSHPWMDVAKISVEQLLPFETMVKMGFNIANHPKSLGFIPAENIRDFNSIVYMRSKTKIAYRSRLLAYKLFGLPKPVPETAPRNQ